MTTPEPLSGLVMIMFSLNEINENNENIIITKPDKGSGIVILNKNDFIDKMLGILDDLSKFEKLGPTSNYYDVAVYHGTYF